MVSGTIKGKILEHMYLFITNEGEIYVLEIKSEWDTSPVDTWLSTQKTPLRAVIIGNTSDKITKGYKVIEVENIKSLESGI